MAREESCNLDKEEAEILKLKHPPSSSSSSPSLFNKSASQEPPVKRPESAQPSDADLRPVVAASGPEKSGEAEAKTPVRYASRCSSCRRRVGLTGFRCRCGDLFCGRHRYSDTHDCSFDYKAAGREEISKANPLIRAAKIIKI